MSTPLFARVQKLPSFATQTPVQVVLRVDVCITPHLEVNVLQ